MHGDHETGHDPTFLPPFVARPREPRARSGEDRPLPPWSSEGRDLPGPAPEAAAPDALEAPWTPAEASGEPEPWNAPPEPSEVAHDAAAGVDEPWPGEDPALDSLEDAWTPLPEPATDDEPWSAPPREPEAEPWLLEEDTEALLIDEAAHEPWLELADEAPPRTDASEPWKPASDVPSGAAAPWDDDIAAVGGGGPDPWATSGGDVTDEVPGDRPESDLPPAPASPLDELVETAGQALAGSASAWAEAPLDTWPGEAEAWDAVATTGEVGVPSAEPDDGSDLNDIARRLEQLAADVRMRGAAALTASPERDRLGAALAAFLDGWRAAHRNG